MNASKWDWEKIDRDQKQVDRENQILAQVRESNFNCEGDACPHCDTFLGDESETGFNWCPVCRELIRTRKNFK